MVKAFPWSRDISFHWDCVQSEKHKTISYISVNSQNGILNNWWEKMRESDRARWGQYRFCLAVAQWIHHTWWMCPWPTWYDTPVLSRCWARWRPSAGAMLDLRYEGWPNIEPNSHNILCGSVKLSTFFIDGCVLSDLDNVGWMSAQRLWCWPNIVPVFDGRIGAL